MSILDLQGMKMPETVASSSGKSNNRCGNGGGGGGGRKSVLSVLCNVDVL